MTTRRSRMARHDQPAMTRRRMKNLEEAFGYVTWEWWTVGCVNRGMYGDRPQFEVEGRVDFNFLPGPVQITYRTASPAGGLATLRAHYGGRQIYYSGRAGLIYADKIWEELSEKAKEEA